MPTEHIDLSNLERLFRGNRSLVIDWMLLYMQEAPIYFKQLSDSVEIGDAETLATAAHDLQPQAHYLGSARMAELLAAIEEQALKGNAQGCSDLMHALLPVREAIEDELRSVLNAT
ncbi:MAG: Hpt domain-containing protein [Flavobacteriales bacterium]